MRERERERERERASERERERERERDRYKRNVSVRELARAIQRLVARDRNQERA